MTKLPPLNTLRCFEAAARHRSFSRAADELHITQSAVSHQVRQLEEWCGVPLFVRHGRTTAPTERGEELARSLAEAFSVVQEACKRVRLTDQRPPLTVAVLPSIGTIWLVPQMQEFFSKYPEIPVKIVYSIHNQRLAFDDVDIAIVWGAGAGQGGNVTRLFSGETVAVLNAALMEKHGPFLKPDQLLSLPILHDTDVSGWQRYFRKAGVRHSGILSGPHFEDFNLLRAAVLAGQGVALCPRSIIEGDLASRRLAAIFPDIAINEDHGYWLVEPDDPERRTPTVAAFKQWILEKAAGTQA
jgi:LysR family transcriptional regulator, glycine cleavage system transcriptional activator